MTADSDQFTNFPLQRRKKFGLEPGVFLQPAVVAPGGMRQGQDARLLRMAKDVAPAPHGLGEPVLEVSPRCQACAYWPISRTRSRSGSAWNSGWRQASAHSRRGRQVAAFRILPGKAGSHRHDGDLGGIVESRFIQSEPGAQPGAGTVRERDPAGMGPGARCLACDAQTRGGTALDDRTRFVRQGRAVARRIAADAAGPQLRREIVEIRLGIHSLSNGNSPRRSWRCRPRDMTSPLTNAFCASPAGARIRPPTTPPRGSGRGLPRRRNRARRRRPSRSPPSACRYPCP